MWPYCDHIMALKLASKLSPKKVQVIDYKDGLDYINALRSKGIL